MIDGRQGVAPPLWPNNSTVRLQAVVVLGERAKKTGWEIGLWAEPGTPPQNIMRRLDEIFGQLREQVEKDLELR